MDERLVGRRHVALDRDRRGGGGAAGVRNQQAVQEINPADGSNAPVNHKPLKRCVTNQICASNPKNNLNNRQQHIL